MDESKAAFCCLFLSGCDAAGAFELVETALDYVANSVKPVIDADAHFADLVHRNFGQDIAFIHKFSNAVTS